MLGKRSGQRGLFEADSMYGDFVGEDTFYGWLASERGRLFRDEDFASLYCHTNGRASVPPSLLGTALVLQTYEGVSDAGAKDHADYDLRWKVALGVEIRERPFAKSTLQLFRAQLVIHEKARELFTRSIEKARDSGFLKRRKKLHAVVDTMTILGRGAVKDTYNLLADGIVKLARALAALEGDEDVSAWAQRRELGRYFAPSVKGTARVDWDDAASAQRFLGGIVADADRLLALAGEACGLWGQESEEGQRLRQAAELLMQLLAQDIERGEDGPAIRDGVAKERIVSVHDPEMRHGRKSSKTRFDGHKGAVAVDSESQLITAVGVAAGGAHDGDTALPLIQHSEETTGLEVAETVGDCAYGDGRTRGEFAEGGRTLIAPVPRPPRTDKFPKTAFRIGRKLDRVTCPGGCTTRRWHRATLAADRRGERARVKRFVFPAARCASCTLRDRCVKGTGPRTITLHPREPMMQAARRYQGTEGFRQAKRRRQVVEHRIARLRQLGVRQARYMGRAKTLFQLLMAATVANLTLIASRSRSVGGRLCAMVGLVRRFLGRAALALGIRARPRPRCGPLGLARRQQLASAIPSYCPTPWKPAAQNRGSRPRF